MKNDIYAALEQIACLNGKADRPFAFKSSQREMAADYSAEK